MAIDPGPERSAYVFYDVAWGRLWNAEIVANETILEKFAHQSLWPQRVAVEMIASYGMAVGAEVFETCVWIGRFIQAYPGPTDRIFRRDVKLELCGSPRAKDANVRQAIVDLYGGKAKAIGTKKSPGPLYGVRADSWQALGVAVTWAAKNGQVYEGVGSASA